MTGIIDEQGFRLNVGMVIVDAQGRVFWGRRMGKRDAWQFPQGGMMRGETPEEALYRELEEEVGLLHHDVELLASTQGWLSYRLPRRFLRRRRRNQRQCIGQRQKWFLLQLTGPDEKINLTHSGKPEFQDWRWVHYWYPLNKVVHFKREVYQQALEELEPVFKTISQGPFSL